MLGKNEIKLLEARNGKTIRRLVFTENGFIQLVDDFHFDGISVSSGGGSLIVREISPTVRMVEEDFALEQVVDDTTGESSFGLYRFNDGSLRSISLSTNLGLLQSIISRNREINRWMTTSVTQAIHDRVFPNASYVRPTAVQASMAFLKNLIPNNGLWSGKLDINPMSLVMSYHKLHRLLVKQPLTLNKRAKHPTVVFDEALLQEKNVDYFELSTRGQQAVHLTAECLPTLKDNIVVKITHLGNIELAKQHGQLQYPYGNDIYRIELIQFVKTPVENLPKGL